MDNSPTHTQRICIVDDWDALMVQINDFAIAQKVGNSVRIAIDGCQRLSRSALAGVDVPPLAKSKGKDRMFPKGLIVLLKLSGGAKGTE